MYNRAEAIALMNKWGKQRIPFFFFTDFTGTRAFLSTLQHLPPSVSYAFGTVQEEIPQELSFQFEKYPVSYRQFKQSFDYVVEQINLGNSYLANLTCETPITTNLTLQDIYRISNAHYKVLYDDHFVLFSPETFVQIKGDRIFSYPMKGTIDATTPNAREVILNNPKETAEHVTIVDLIRNDLSQVASNVHVPKFRFITPIKTHEKTLLQVSSEICGDLDAAWSERLGDILFQLLPAGSISGAPKQETVRIIQQAERYNREFYTGVCGLFDGQQLDSGVMIRFIQNHSGQLVYKSGGGITSFSDAASEYQELTDKVYVPLY